MAADSERKFTSQSPSITVEFSVRFNFKTMICVQDNFGSDLAGVEAATKKHEAIETDVKAYEERVQAVVAVVSELQRENYHDIKRINDR